VVGHGVVVVFHRGLALELQHRHRSSLLLRQRVPF
jgi:hypothetical protein